MRGKDRPVFCCFFFSLNSSSFKNLLLVSIESHRSVVVVFWLLLNHTDIFIVMLFVAYF